jgi:hypothetical protein
MKKTDWVLISILLFIAGVAFVILNFTENNNSLTDGIAIVYYNDEQILKINLEDGSYQILDSTRIIGIDEDRFIYHVLGSNPYGVYIKFDNHKVKVIDEESPKHICQTQGWTNSPLLPLTCLPNNIMIVIESSNNQLPDEITG